MRGRLRRVLRAIEPHPGEHFKDKAIALGLAFVLWFVINAEEAVTEFFENVPVNLENRPLDLAIAAEWAETIDIRVRGSTRAMSNLTTGRLSPTIDLTIAGPGENIFPLFGDNIPVPSGVTVERINPDRIVIILENRVEKLVAISPVVSGEPAAGYEVVGKTTDPEYAWLSGPSSLLESIERIPTQTVDVSGRQESFTQTVPLLSNEFIELTRERTTALTIEIRERAVTAVFDGLEIDVIGSAYRVDVNPQLIGVELSGPASVLNELREGSLRVIVDATGLEPRREDYRIEPQVVFDPPELAASIEVEHFTPQSYIDVHVYNTPSDRRQ